MICPHHQNSWIVKTAKSSPSSHRIWTTSNKLLLLTQSEFKTTKSTADAVKSALKELPDFKGQILILYGDVPLVSYSTLDNLLNHHRSDKILAQRFWPWQPQPNRIWTHLSKRRRNAEPHHRRKRRIRRWKTGSSGQYGLMVLEGENLGDHLDKIKTKCSAKEFYLVDLPEILAKDNLSTGVIRGDFQELRGINSEQLAELELAWQHNKRLSIMESGVTLIDPNTVYFQRDTVIGRDTIIEQGVIFGKASPSRQCRDQSLQPYRRRNNKIRCHHRPIRPHPTRHHHQRTSAYRQFCRSQKLDHWQGRKANHLGYIGDTELGAQSILVAAQSLLTMTGKQNQKQKSEERHDRINSSLIAPIEIGDGATSQQAALDQKCRKDTLVIAIAETKSLAGKAKTGWKE